MPKIKTSELTGPALDWAVAKCEGMSADMLNEFYEGEWTYSHRRYSTDWAQGGPIIERERIQLRPERGSEWRAFSGIAGPDMSGPTPAGSWLSKEI